LVTEKSAPQGTSEPTGLTLLYRTMMPTAFKTYSLISLTGNDETYLKVMSVV